MHYDTDEKVKELIAHRHIGGINAENGEISIIQDAQSTGFPKNMAVEDLRSYVISRDHDIFVYQFYLFNPSTETWAEVHAYGSNSPLTLTHRDFKKQPAMEGDIFAPTPPADTEEQTSEDPDSEDQAEDKREEQTDECARDEAPTDEYVSEFNGMTIQQLLSNPRYKDLIIDEIISQYPPLYDADNREQLARQFAQIMEHLGRKPMKGQAEGILSSTLSMKKNRGTTIVGEMGCGKTTMAIMVAMLNSMRLVAVVSPVHLTRKWKREIEQTVPNASAFIIENIRPVNGRKSTPTQMDLETFRNMAKDREEAGTLTPQRPMYAIFPSTLASLSHSGEGTSVQSRIFRDPSNSTRIMGLDACGNPIWREQPRLTRITRKEEVYSGPHTRPTIVYRNVKAQVCPDCFAPVRDKDGVTYVDSTTFWKKRLKCKACDGALWSARKLNLDRSADRDRLRTEEYAARRHKPVARWKGPHESAWHGKARYALGDFVAKKMRRFFDLLIADEVHEYKSEGAARGIVVGNMSRAAKKSLSLTGTLMGGYSSTLFFLLQRFGNQIADEFSYKDEKRWVQRYGFEQTIKKKDIDESSYNNQSRGFKSTTTREKPGLSPLALPFILGNTSFIRLLDVTDNLPPYRETVRLIDLDETKQKDEISQASAYSDFQEEFTSAIAQSVRSGSHKMLGAYMHALLAYPDNPVIAEKAYDAEGDLIASAPALDPDVIYPKEEELVRI
ncbi:MAG: DEAD/DEAH box helicase family protein, partial [Dehalococcoidia bacterium]|nr:DEAD/DEAH box helicase family protein [Dehalococcoidia bacterium]